MFYLKKKNNYLDIIICFIFIFGILISKDSFSKLTSIIFLFYYVGNSIEKEVYLLLFVLFFTTLTPFNIFGITLSSLCQVILISKILFREKFNNLIPSLLCILILVAFQGVAILFFNQTLNRMIVMILNFTMMVILREYAGRISKRNLENYYIFGLILMLLVAIIKQGDFFTQTAYRFKGLWTDSNFLGLFCSIGLSFCYLRIKSRKNYILNTCLSLFIFYCGYRTYSLTFIFVMGIFGMIIFKELLTSKLRMWIKICICILFIISIIIIFKHYLMPLLESRFLGKSDFSHGRSRTWENAIDFWSNNMGTLFLGMGYENVANYTAYKASHCTYIDLFVEFGLLGIIPTIFLFINSIGTNNLKLKKLLGGESTYIFILFIYGITLSLLSFDIMYLLLGVSKILTSRKIGELRYDKKYYSIC